MKRHIAIALTALALDTATNAAPLPTYDVIIRNGTIYDGSGKPGYRGDVAIRGDKILYVGAHARGRATHVVDAKGKAVAPGFINMLSWGVETLIADGRGLSDLHQGFTLEVFGEGESMGPLTPEMKERYEQRQNDIKYPITWTTLGDYLEFLEKRGVSPNVASFIGAATPRVHELGERDVDPNPEQLQRMRGLVHQAMQQGALGVASALIYAPGSYAETPELIALAEEAGRCGGMYISHMRSEGDRVLESVDELIEISRKSGTPAEIYHMKQAGVGNWGKLDAMIAKIEAARAKGQRITADMYTYTAGFTGLDASMPRWVQDGGLEAWIERMKDPSVRARVAEEMRSHQDKWENMMQLAGGPENVLMVAFKSDKLKPLIGKTLAEIARMRGTSPEETAIDLVVEDGSRIGAAYFIMSEDNVKRQVGLPWMSFNTDAEAPTPEGIFLKSNVHPRAYGMVPRLLGKYVRDEKAAVLPDAIRRLTSLPASNLSLKQRGRLKPGYFADVVLFDPTTIQDHATYAKPHQLSTGVSDVFVNGVQVLKDGQHTGAKPGRFVRGPGWTGWPGGGACRRS